MGSASSLAESQPLIGRRVAFVGKLGGVTKRQAQQLVRQQGGTTGEVGDPTVDLIVIGADEFPFGDESLDQATCRAAAENQVEIITETQLWQRMGLVEEDHSIQRLYTPAMLAELLGVPVAIIRRWHRRRLIVPTREVHRLPYFDFQEVANARRLAQLLAAGASPAAIEQKLEELARFVPEVERPLAQLSVIVQGRQLLLRQGEGLIEPGGQRHFDFDAPDQLLPHDAGEGSIASINRPTQGTAADPTPVLSFPQQMTTHLTGDELLSFAADLEDQGQLESAIELYRTFLMMKGPSASACFALAELLYRVGDLSAARERYYMAVELDDDYVEARANLGCVLVEMGQPDLAIAAFYGALEQYRDYADVHYHLARTLDDLDRTSDAIVHWKEFLALAPESPWAEEARSRVEEVTG
jgi:tetratricopeptide (TPR) repeat protein